MKVTAPYDCYLVALNRQVQSGETVKVEQLVGASLVSQGWTQADPPPAKKPAVKKTANPISED